MKENELVIKIKGGLLSRLITWIFPSTLEFTMDEHKHIWKSSWFSSKYDLVLNEN